MGRALQLLAALFGMGGRDKTYHSRRYYALREAQALRLQHNAGAEAVCAGKLSAPDATPRDRRFYRLVRRELRRV